MTAEKKTVKTNRGLRAYTYLGCPLTRNRSAWCYRLCSPDDGGHGVCGRVAPHGLKSKTQLSIAKYNKSQLEAHCAKLEQMYLESSRDTKDELGIRVEMGETEIVIPLNEHCRHADGSVHSSICSKAMIDAATIAVNSVVPDELILTQSFNFQLETHKAAGDLIAKGHYIGAAGDQYMAETVVTDSDGVELGRGGGTFVAGTITP